MSVNHIDSVELRNELINNHPILVIDYYATWCKPCKRIAPDYEKMAKEYEGKIVFAKEDYSENLDLEDLQEQVKCLPTFHIYVNKELTSVVEGAELDRVRQNLELSLANCN